MEPCSAGTTEHPRSSRSDQRENGERSGKEVFEPTRELWSFLIDGGKLNFFRGAPGGALSFFSALALSLRRLLHTASGLETHCSMSFSHVLIPSTPESKKTGPRQGLEKKKRERFCFFLRRFFLDRTLSSSSSKIRAPSPSERRASPPSCKHDGTLRARRQADPADSGGW